MLGENPLFLVQHPYLEELDLKHSDTLPETNVPVAPEHRPSEKETSVPTIHFQVLC